MSLTSSGSRVKVYRLEDEAWLDLGTGYCSILSEADDEQIVVISETASKQADEERAKKRQKTSDEQQGLASEEIWRTHIRSVIYLSEGPEGAGGNYQRQQDTLIVWTEADGTDLALSFANIQGCAQVWDFIQHVRSLVFDLDLSSSGESAGSGSSDPLSDEDALQHPSAADYAGAANRRRSSMVSSADASPNKGLGVSTSSNATMAHQPLPDPTLANLNEVEAALKWTSRTPHGRERLASWIYHTAYIRALCTVFTDAEDLEALESLHSLCVILQGILLLNDNTLFEFILQDDIFFSAVGILEYDPEFPTMKANHREHLSDPARFSEVVPIRDATTLQKVHQTYRLQYLKDTILARIIDDPTFSMLNSFIFFNQVDIVSQLQTDDAFLEDLFAIFENDSTSKTLETNNNAETIIGPMPPTAKDTDMKVDETNTNEKRESTIDLELTKQHSAILLLQQFCSLAKNLQLAARNQFYRVMGQRGLLRVLERALTRTSCLSKSLDEVDPVTLPIDPKREKEEEMRIATIDILMMVIDHNPAGVRAYCLSKINEKEEKATDGDKATSEARSLVLFLIDLLLSESDLGIQAQMAEAIKVLVSTAGEPLATGPAEAARAKSEDPEAEKFLQYFYESCIGDLFKPITTLADPSTLPSPHQLQLTNGKSALCAHLCDLLCYFVAAHSFRSKYFVLSSTICNHVARLFHTTQKHLSLAALRFFKACLVRKDDFYNRYLMKNDLFKAVLDTAQTEFLKSRDNMLISAILDFFEFIRTNNLKAVLNHLMDKHGDQIKALAEKDETIMLTVAKWEQNNEPPPEPTNPETANAVRQAPRETKTLEAEEESYFNDSSEGEEDKTSTQSTTPRKRQKSDHDASVIEEQQPARKRARKNTPDSPRAPSTMSATLSSPPLSRSQAGMVRSPALVFQEMALKGAQGTRRRLSLPKTQGLVSYGDDEDEEMAAETNEKSLERTQTIFPEEGSVDKPLPATPDRASMLSPPNGEATSLGSPFQAVSAPLSPTLQAEKPALSLKSLGDKRRREEEEEDVLATKSSANPKKGKPAVQKLASNGSLGSKLKINLKSSLGIGSGEKK